MSNKIITKVDKLAILILVSALYGWLCILYYKFYNFGYWDWDLAFFTQAMWNLAHGSQFASMVGINFFGDHSYYFSFLLLPVFSLFQSPVTLISLKVIGFFISAFLLYRIARAECGSFAGLMILILYIIFPANVFSLLYEFNPECFSSMFIFMMLYAFKKDNLRLFWFSAVLLMLIKENMMLIVVMFGVLALFVKAKNKWNWGLLPILVAGLSFYIVTNHLIPYFRGLEDHAFLVRYRHLGASKMDILSTLLNPVKLWPYIFNELNFKYLIELFGPLLLPSVFNFSTLLLMFPVLFQHLLSIHYPEHTIFYHYASSMVPFIFFAFINTLKLVKNRFGLISLNVIVIICVTLTMMNVWNYRHEVVNRIDNHRDGLTMARWSLVKKIPEDASVIATFDFLAALSTRKSLYAFHKVYNDLYQDKDAIKNAELNVGKAFVPPEDLNYALIDFQDPWLMQDMRKDHDKISSRVQKFLEGWEEIDRVNSIVLYKKI